MRLQQLPSPTLHASWESWGHALIQRLLEAGSEQEQSKADLLLAATGVGGISAATFSFIGWSERIKASKLYFHDAASNNDTVTFAQRGSYIINADLLFTATALQNVDARVFISGADYGALTTGRAEGTNYIRCPILGALVQVSESDTLKIGVQGSATTVLTGVSRLWVRKL